MSDIFEYFKWCPLAYFNTTRFLAVTGSGSIGSVQVWQIKPAFSAQYDIVVLTYLLSTQNKRFDAAACKHYSENWKYNSYIKNDRKELLTLILH